VQAPPAKCLEAYRMQSVQMPLQTGYNYRLLPWGKSLFLETEYRFKQGPSWVNTHVIFWWPARLDGVTPGLHSTRERSRCKNSKLCVSLERLCRFWSISVDMYLVTFKTADLPTLRSAVVHFNKPNAVRNMKLKNMVSGACWV